MTPKLKAFREELGFLPDHDLYDFSKAVVERIIADCAKVGEPLSDIQIAIANSYFNEFK